MKTKDIETRAREIVEDWYGGPLLDGPDDKDLLLVRLADAIAAFGKECFEAGRDETRPCAKFGMSCDYDDADQAPAPDWKAHALMLAEALEFVAASEASKCATCAHAAREALARFKKAVGK